MPSIKDIDTTTLSEAAAYEALPELEKAKLAYAAGPDNMLYDMIEAYRFSVNGEPRPANWQPSDQHLLAMWMAMPDHGQIDWQALEDRLAEDAISFDGEEQINGTYMDGREFAAHAIAMVKAAINKDQA